MAYAISISYLTSEQTNQIQTLLCLYPQVSNNKYNHNEIFGPISFFIVDNDKDHRSQVHLPYFFAATLLQITPNIDRLYPAFLSSELEFKATLCKEQIVVERQAWKQLKQHGSTVLNIRSGFGTPLIISKLIIKIRLLTVVLVYHNMYADMWKQSLQKYTTSRIWIIGQKQPDSFNIIICTCNKWKDIPDNYRSDIGFVIITEANMFCTSSYIPCLLSFHPRYLLLESSTNEANSLSSNMICALAGSHSVTQ